MKKHHKVKIGEETIYLRESYLGWEVIHPYKIDGKINWKNIIAGGSWLRLLIMIIIVSIIIGCISEYSTVLKVANDCINNSLVWTI